MHFVAPSTAIAIGDEKKWNVFFCWANKHLRKFDLVNSQTQSSLRSMCLADAVASDRYRFRSVLIKQFIFTHFFFLPSVSTSCSIWSERVLRNMCATQSSIILCAYTTNKTKWQTFYLYIYLTPHRRKTKTIHYRWIFVFVLLPNRIAVCCERHEHMSLTQQTAMSRICFMFFERSECYGSDRMPKAHQVCLFLLSTDQF